MMLPELLADSLELCKLAHGGHYPDAFAREIEARQEGYRNREFYREAIEEVLDAPVYLWLKLLEQHETMDEDQWLEQRQLTAGVIATLAKAYIQIRQLERNEKEA